ncbi:MAG: TonB family protein [Calditrichia bacterium]|nr:TonB family protein [Calditrichia bacterium]
MNKINYSLLIILVIFITSYSQVHKINGEKITGNVNWRGTIVIAGDVTIEQKSRLVIEPGTKVLFEPKQDLAKGGSDKTRCEIIVRGTLIARGLPGRKIIFSSNSSAPRMGDWYSIEFLHIRTGTLLEYCVIEYAHNGITIKNSNIIVNNCELRYNYHAGIRTEVKANPEIKNSIISENGYAGLICELGSKPVLTNNLISLNRIGVVAFSLSQPNLGNMAPGENYNPGRNNIFNNEEFDFYNHSNKEIFAENNYWGDENVSSIALQLYDKNDNSKYGTVDYVPVLKQSGQQNLSSMLLLAQDTGETPRSSSPAPDAQQNYQPSIRESSLKIEDTTVQNSEGQNLATTEGVNGEDIDLSKKIDEMAPLMASISSPEPIARELPANSKEVKNQIDYDRIFLELFLDGGKKKYFTKPKIEISQVPRNVWQKGEIRVKVVVDRGGNVESATILRGINDILDQAVLKTVERYEFQTGRINGQPVKFTTNEVFRFE